MTALKNKVEVKNCDTVPLYIQYRYTRGSQYVPWQNPNLTHTIQLAPQQTHTLTLMWTDQVRLVDNTKNPTIVTDVYTVKKNVSAQQACLKRSNSNSSGLRSYVSSNNSGVVDMIKKYWWVILLVIALIVFFIYYNNKQ